MESVYTGKFGDVFASDYVFDETVTVALIRAKSVKRPVEVGNYIKQSISILENQGIKF